MGGGWPSVITYWDLGVEGLRVWELTILSTHRSKELEIFYEMFIERGIPQVQVKLVIGYNLVSYPVEFCLWAVLSVGLQKSFSR